MAVFWLCAFPVWLRPKPTSIVFMSFPLIFPPQIPCSRSLQAPACGDPGYKRPVSTPLGCPQRTGQRSKQSKQQRTWQPGFIIKLVMSYLHPWYPLVYLSGPGSSVPGGTGLSSACNLPPAKSFLVPAITQQPSSPPTEESGAKIKRHQLLFSCTQGSKAMMSLFLPRTVTAPRVLDVTLITHHGSSQLHLPSHPIPLGVQ